MRAFKLAWIAAVAGAACAPCVWGGDAVKTREFHLQWRDLQRATRGYQVALQLPSGIKLQGTPIAFEADEMMLDVSKTSNKRAYPKGRAIIPRPEVTRLRVIKTRHKFRILGTAIGAGIGGALAAPATELADNLAGNRAMAGVLAVAVPAGIGYLAGWAADINVMEIVVEPDR